MAFRMTSHAEAVSASAHPDAQNVTGPGAYDSDPRANLPTRPSPSGGYFYKTANGVSHSLPSVPPQILWYTIRAKASDRPFLEVVQYGDAGTRCGERVAGARVAKGRRRRVGFSRPVNFLSYVSPRSYVPHRPALLDRALPRKRAAVFFEEARLKNVDVIRKPPIRTASSVGAGASFFSL